MRPVRWLRQNGLNLYAGLAIAYMLAPIVVIAVFSFNETPRGTLDFALNGSFTLEYWTGAFEVPELNEALDHIAAAGRALHPDLHRDRDPDGPGAGPLRVLRAAG